MRGKEQRDPRAGGKEGRACAREGKRIELRVGGRAAPLAREKKLWLAYISRQRLRNPHHVCSQSSSHLWRDGEGEGEEKEGERKRKERGREKRAAEHMKSGTGAATDGCPARLRPIRMTQLVRATPAPSRLLRLPSREREGNRGERGREEDIPNPHLVCH